MHAKLSPSIRLAGCAAALLCAGVPARGAAVVKDAFPTYESYIKLSGQTPWVSGNSAAYQKRTQSRADGSAGIEDLHLSRDVAKSTTLLVDGRAMAGAEDYLLRVNVTREGVGAVDAGYSRFRTFYDAIGGFFPLNARWLPLSPEALHTDRGRFWAEAKIALKDKPVFTLRYTNETRSGEKDSLTWGDSNLTGLPLLPANNATRKIIPVLLDLNERQQRVEASVKHTVGNTTAQVRLLSDWVNNWDSRTFVRYPLEVTPNPQRINLQADGLRTHSVSAIGTTETVLNERMTFNTGLSYQHLTSQVRGYRANAIGVLPTYDFKDLAGGSNVHVYTGNASLGWTPAKNWYVQPALRYEDNSSRSAGTFNRVTQASITAPQVTTYFNENERIKEQIVTPDLSVRYTGFNRLVIYGSASDRINRGDERRTDQYSTAVPTSAQIWLQDVNQDQAHYTLGANWNASSAVVLRGEVFHKEHENKFLGYENKLGSRYVIGYEFTGVKLTAILKPMPELSFTTRYLPQTGTMQVTTEATRTFDSMEAKSHLIGETIDWNPNSSVYVQLNANVGFNYISSAYPSSANPSQRNADNNYRTGSIITGWVMSTKTDANLQYTYQRADNFQPELAAFTQPYGASYEESTITVGLKHKISAKWIGSLKVGYFESTNDTTGGRTNFRGPLAYVAMEHEL
jgi:hypothetical protein